MPSLYPWISWGSSCSRAFHQSSSRCRFLQNFKAYKIYAGTRFRFQGRLAVDGNQALVDWNILFQARVLGMCYLVRALVESLKAQGLCRGGEDRLAGIGYGQGPLGWRLSRLSRRGLWCPAGLLGLRAPLLQGCEGSTHRFVDDNLWFRFLS